MSIDVRFNIQRGDFNLVVDTVIPNKGVTAIFGPSGSGKTTLLRAISGLEQCEDGYLKVGETVWQDNSWFVPTYKRKIGYVFQEPSLFTHLNVQNNINYGMTRAKCRNSVSKLPHTIELLQISHLLQRMPWQLSGGEQQRVAIARALAADPTMLLLDEPLAALGDEQKAAILPFLESVYKTLAIPVLYVSHSREEVACLADHLLLLDHGRLHAAGTVKDIFTDIDLPLAHQTGAESIIEATVAGYNTHFGLVQLEFSGGTFSVASASLPAHSNVRIQVLARDVSITLERQKNTSILNIIAVTIDRIEPETNAQMILRLVTGNTVLLSRISCKSAYDLDLKKGDKVYAQIKSASLLI
jgi:molybdate transport system ATP-binding protein